MRILFISHDLVAGNIAYLMKKEGHDVKIFINEKGRRNNFDGLLNKTSNWKKELNWVGKSGLIVFDDIGFGKEQNNLRKLGYSVLGGSLGGDNLEIDRELAQKVFKDHKIRAVPLKTFSNCESAIKFAKTHPGPLVIKQNQYASKGMNYVGVFKDNRDVISVLENYRKNNGSECHPLYLQKRIYGVEIGVARYFNGFDWVGPIEVNIEHKKFFPGDLGPTTGEMGTLAWYDDNEKNKLFTETLAKLKPYLQKINFRGDIDINCIVNKSGAYPLEATPRFGSPIIQLHTELNISPWGELLKAVADGKKYNLKWRKGFGVVVLIATPPLPYSKKIKGSSSEGIDIYFTNSFKKSWMKHVHFEEVSLGKKGQFYISDSRGYVMYVTEMGKTPEIAASKTYSLINKIVIPKMFYRNDIGLNFKDDQIKLRKWGYL